MRILVCVKAVPGSTEVKMDPKTNTIVRDGGSAVLNPFDASALEVALALKDAAAAGDDPVRVTVLSMGIPATAKILRDCIARGADDAILLSDRAFAGADTLATTYALSLGAAAMGEAPDLVLCGKMAVDGDTAQIGPELAGALGIPCVATVELALPALLTVAKDIAQLRMPSIAGVRAAEDAPVRVLSAADAGADSARCGLAGSPTQVVRSFVPERSGAAERVEGTAAGQAAKLVDLLGGMGL